MSKILFFCLKLRYFNDLNCKFSLTFSPLSKELGFQNVILNNKWILDILLYFELEISYFNLFLILYLIISILMFLISWNVFSLIIYMMIRFKLFFPFIMNYLDNNKWKTIYTLFNLSLMMGTFPSPSMLMMSVMDDFVGSPPPSPLVPDLPLPDLSGPLPPGPNIWDNMLLVLWTVVCTLLCYYWLDLNNVWDYQDFDWSKEDIWTWYMLTSMMHNYDHVWTEMSMSLVWKN